MSSKKAKSIAVTGCSGFIGSHILTKLLNTTDYQVYGIDLSHTKISHLLDNPSLKFFPLDVTDISKVKEIISNCHTVISLAAICNPSLYNKRPIDVITINYSKTLDIVRMCSETRTRLIQFSTCEVYGKTLSGLSDNTKQDEYLKEDETNLIMGPVKAQRWSYAAAKQLLERTIYAYGYEYDLDYTIIRPFNFIGPKMDFIPGIDGEGIPRVIACFMEALLFHKPLKLVDGGKNRRCFTYIDDAVDAIMLILQNPEKAKKQIFNVGNPENETTISDLASLMIELFSEMNLKQSSSPITTEVISSHDFYGNGYEDSDRRLPDISKIHTLLGWTPKTSLRDALRATISAYIEEYGIKSGTHS